MMRCRPQWLGCVLVGLWLAHTACSREKPRALGPSMPPPVTRVEPVAETLHGVEVVDRYRWLEDDSGQVSAWTDAQNRYTRGVLEQLPGRRAVQDRLRPLVQTGSVTAPVVRGNRYFSARRAASQERPAIYVRDGALGAERLLIDPTGAAANRTGVTWLSPSEDGKVLAYGSYQPSDERTTLRLLDVDSGKPLDLEIPNVLEAVQWVPDGTAFLYHTLKDPSDPYTRQGLLHRLGTPAAADRVLYRQFTRAENPRMAETGGPSSTLSRDGRWLVLSYWLEPGSNDIWLAKFDDYLQKGARAATIVSLGRTGTADGTVIGDTLYLYTTKGAPKGRVVTASVTEPGEKRWREVVPERNDAIEAVAFGRGTIVITYVRNASTAIEVFDLDGRSLGMLNQPAIGSATIAAREDRTEAYLTFASFSYPPTVFRVDLATPAAAPKYWSGPDVPFDPSSVQIDQVSYPSRDGTKVSMFVVHKKGLGKNGDSPVILSGYGAFGVSLVPTFAAPFLQWFEAGGVLAVPNLRGGGEYGDAWHQAGMLGRKQNTVDDLVAAAEWLVANGYTNPRKLAVYGLSNGALVAGAAIAARPELFRAAVLGGPLADMVRYHKFAKEPYWSAEYGSADNADAFKWLMGFSPYHRLVAGTKYPAVLLTAVEGDAEVPALHARKLTAALQASSASDRSQPVLLRVDRPTSEPSALFDLELRDLVDQRIFLMWQLGML